VLFRLYLSTSSNNVNNLVIYDIGCGIEHPLKPLPHQKFGSMMDDN